MNDVRSHQHHPECRRLDQVRERLRAASGGAVPELVAASKTVAPEVLGRVLDHGHRTFGENRVQEAVEKWPALREAHPDVSLHLIGPLQSNKVRAAVELFDVIQSLDRPSLAAALARAVGTGGRSPDLYVQVNIGGERQKSGVAVEDLHQFVAHCTDEFGLRVLGLMCIPPVDADPRPYFEELMRLADAEKLPVRSMGMSGDFDVAAAVGATHVRVGSSIFGDRPWPAAASMASSVSGPPPA